MAQLTTLDYSHCGSRMSRSLIAFIIQQLEEFSLNEQNEFRGFNFEGVNLRNEFEFVLKFE
jgi:hypothetical protein